MRIEFEGEKIEIKLFPGNQFFVAYNGKEAWFKIQGTKWVKVLGGMSDKTLQAIKKAAGEQHRK
jgi:hypothetical protein